MGLPKNIGIFCKQKPSISREVLADVTGWLRQRKHTVFMDRETAAIIGESSTCEKPEIPSLVEIIIVLGGDGTLLNVARIAHPYDVPILAINLGSLGFLTEVSLPGLHVTLEKVLNGQFTIENRMLLNAVLWRDGQKVGDYSILNEVVINKGAVARIVDLEVHVDDHYMTSYRADGLIIATPTGSTAYSLSAGGPIIHPSMNALVLCPICPFALTNRPIVIPDQSEIKVKVTTENEDVRISPDGQAGCDMKQGDVLVVKKAENYIQLIQSPDRNFYQILREKLHWGKKADGSGS